MKIVKGLCGICPECSSDGKCKSKYIFCELMHEKEIAMLRDCCDECLKCAYYWRNIGRNTDIEIPCYGRENKPCHEYIEFKGIVH